MARAEWQFGYYVLPILHGDRLIGRLDPAYERATKKLRIASVHAEPDAPKDAGPEIVAAIAELAGWLGAVAITFDGPLPAIWRPALRDIA